MSSVKFPLYMIRFMRHLERLNIISDEIPSIDMLLYDSGKVKALAVRKDNAALVIRLAKCAMQHIHLIRTGLECGWRCNTNSRDKLIKLVRIKLNELLNEANHHLSIEGKSFTPSIGDMNAFYNMDINTILIRIIDEILVFRCDSLDHAISLAGRGECREFCLSRLSYKEFSRCQRDKAYRDAIYHYGNSRNPDYRRRVFFKS